MQDIRCRKRMQVAKKNTKGFRMYKDIIGEKNINYELQGFRNI